MVSREQGIVTLNVSTRRISVNTGTVLRGLMSQDSSLGLLAVWHQPKAKMGHSLVTSESLGSSLGDAGVHLHPNVGVSSSFLCMPTLY